MSKDTDPSDVAENVAPANNEAVWNHKTILEYAKEHKIDPGDLLIMAEITTRSILDKNGI